MPPKDRDYKANDRVPGTVYQVARVVARGGMGTVYEVEDTTIGKQYVLKTLHPQLGDRADLARRMQAEARTLARLNHPNIVEVVTAGVTSDDMRLPYFVMERLSGQNLRVVLQKKAALELPHAYHIAIDLLDALDHAHDKGVIHRDVKPENIYLHRTPSGVTVTKLLDFGIMTMLDGGRGETGGRFLGTLRYASPEQLRGEPPSPRMDLYAAALVLYEMVAGRGPFDDESDMHKVAAAHLNKVAPLASTFAKVPLALDSLLRSALDKNINNRPRDAFAFAAQLRNLKRALGGHSVADSTEHQDTAAAVLSRVESKPIAVRVQQAPMLPASPVSPMATSQPQVSMPSSGPLSGFPKSTLPGMPIASVSGSTLENASRSPTPSQPPMPPNGRTPQVTAPMQTVRSPAPPPVSAVDRLAPTGSIHGSAQPTPRYGTQPMLQSPSTPPPSPPHYSDYPPRWSNVDRGESGQVRTLTPPKDPAGWRKVLAVVAVLVLGGLVVLIGGFAAWKRMAPHGESTTAPTHTEVMPAAAPDPVPVPVVTTPAPTLAPPGLEDPGHTTADAGPKDRTRRPAAGALVGGPRPSNPPTAAVPVVAVPEAQPQPQPQPEPAPAPKGPKVDRGF